VQNPGFRWDWVDAVSWGMVLVVLVPPALHWLGVINIAVPNAVVLP
jgi:hypothetical protein